MNRSILKLVTLACSAASFPLAAQTTYNWRVTDEDAEWGVGVNATTGGTYSRYVDLTAGNPALLLPHSGTFDGAGAGEGPYDGITGVMGAKNRVGAFTRTDPTSIFDLSAVGSSVRIQTVYQGIFNEPDTGGVGHIYQFGLSDFDGVLGSAPGSLVVGATTLGTYNNGGDLGVTADLDFYTGSGLDSAPTDGTWNVSSAGSIASNLTIDGIKVGDGDSHLLDLTYTNIGGGQIEVMTNIVNLDITGRTAADVISGSSLIDGGTYTFADPFTDLTQLRPAFGYSINDSNVAQSGANWDWEVQYDDYIIPEPSAVVLISLAVSIFGLRRRR